jgi:N6-L-threonylcarbamoyladenine synthase
MIKLNDVINRIDEMKKIHDIIKNTKSYIYFVAKKEMIEDSGIKQLAIAGGVSANSELRYQIKNLETTLNIKTFIPKFEYCTDNAGMIGITAYFKYLRGEFTGQDTVPLARYEI